MAGSPHCSRSHGEDLIRWKLGHTCLRESLDALRMFSVSRSNKQKYFRKALVATNMTCVALQAMEENTAKLELILRT